MLDHISSHDMVVEQILRALANCPPAVFGPPTAGCANWMLGIGSGGTHALMPMGQGVGTGGISVPNTLGTRIRVFAQNEATTAIYEAATLNELANAVDDAARFVDRHIAAASPRISLTAEGTVLLTWERGSEGTAILFVGDGTVVYSRSGNGFSYSESGVEYSVREPLPEEYRERINSTI